MAILAALAIWKEPERPRFEQRNADSGIVAWIERQSWRFRRDRMRLQRRALLVTDLRVVNSKRTYDPDSGPTPSPEPTAANTWSFGALLTRALTLGGLNSPDADQAVKSWLNANDEAIEPIRLRWNSTPLAKAPFRLLAVVHRPDLAQFQCDGKAEEKQVCEHEVRFIFALTEDVSQKNLKALVILEFVSPTESKPKFLDYLKELVAVSALPDGQWPDKLMDLTDNRVRAAAKVRLRVSTTRNQVWAFRQFNFTTNGLKRVALDGEISQEAWQTSCVLSSNAVAFLNSNYAKILLHERYGLSEELITQESSTNGSLPILSVDSVDGSLVPEMNRARVRTLLGLSRCSGCHGVETSEQGVPSGLTGHVKQRATGEESKLSKFLIGGARGRNFEVTVDTAGCGVPGEARNYNDLLRRSSWVDMALTLDPNAKSWAEKLRPYRVLEVH